jgi:hypothetical protein
MNLGINALYWPLALDKTPTASWIASPACAYVRNPSQIVLGDWVAMDAWVAALRAVGIEPCFTIDPSLPNVVALVQQAATRYAVPWRINFWEIGNEIEDYSKPWFGNTASLVSLHNQIYAALKPSAPPTTVLHGSVQALQRGGQGLRMLARLFDAGCKTDLLNCHLYPTSFANATHEIPQMVSDLRALAASYGMTQHGVWATEVGVPASNNLKFSQLPQYKQFETMTAYLGLCKATGVNSALWYAWDSIAGPSDKADFGFKGPGDQAMWSAVVAECQ